MADSYVAGKADFLVDYVADHDLDILCITETWLSSENTVAVSAITPSGYLFEHVARSNICGGGVGVLFKSSFTVDHSQLWPASSFECLDLQLRCHSLLYTTPLRHLPTAVVQPQLTAVRHLPHRISRSR